MLLIGQALAEPHLHSTGLRSNILPDPRAATVDVATAFAVGQVDDPVGAEGMAHGLEHLWFEARVEGERVSSQLTRLGCASNAFTGAEWMVFVESCPPTTMAEVLALEAARYDPWVFGEGAAREWRVIAEEELIRAERPEVVEGDFLLRQLLPTSHPLRLRATRVHHAEFPGEPALRAFVEAHFRPDRSAVVVSGAVDVRVVRDTLDRRFGPSSPVSTLSPLRPPPAPRTTLRMAPRTVPGIAATPTVLVGWSQRAPGGMSGPAVDIYIERSLRRVLARDPRVTSVECGHLDVLFNGAFSCRLAAVNDAAAVGVGADLPRLLDWFTPSLLQRGLLDLAGAQTALWSLYLQERHTAEPGTLAVVLAKNLLEGIAAEEADEDLGHWSAEAMLADTALVVVLPGGAPATVDFGRPTALPDGPVSEVKVATLPPPAPALRVAQRQLENGLELIAVQRGDARLVHLALAARAASDPTVAIAAQGMMDNQLLNDVVIDVSDSLVGSLSRQVATLPSLSLAAATRLHNGLTGLTWDAEAEARTRASASVFRGAARGAYWSSVASLVALHPTRASPDPGPLGAAGPAAALRLYAPARTRLVVVGPAEPEAMLNDVAPAWVNWRGSAADEAAPTPVHLAMHTRVTTGGTQAWVSVRCTLPEGGAAAATEAALVEAQLVSSIREQRGRGYVLSAYPVGNDLVVTAATDPDWATEALGYVLDAFSSPSPLRLQAAQAHALGPGSPNRATPDQLADDLASHRLSLADIATWDAAVRALKTDDVTAALNGCRVNAAWSVAGPPATTFPSDAVAADVDQLSTWRVR